MPERPGRPLAYLILGCMELAWILPLCRLSFLFPEVPAIGLREAFAAFALGGLAAGAARGRPWRVIWAAGLELAALLAGEALTLSAVYGSPAAAFSPAGSRGVFALMLNLFWALMFWYRGRKLAHFSFGLGGVGGRFDTGVGALAALALFGWGIQRPAPDLENFAAAYFLLGMFALAADNRRETGTKSRRAFSAGLLLGFIAAVSALGLGLYLFMRPILGEAARTGLRAAGDALAPFVPLLLALLRFLFTFGFARASTRPQETSEGFVVSGRSLGEAEWAWWLRVALTWLIWAVLAAAAAFILVMILRPLLRWLLSRRPGGREPSAGWLANLFARLKRLARLILAALAGMSQRGGPSGPAGRAYRRLAAWGRRSRLAPWPAETPREYGRRFAAAFPGLAGEAEAVVEAFNLECYAGRYEPSAQARLGRLGRRLAEPRWWLARARRWFGPGGPEKRFVANSGRAVHNGPIPK